jgi:peptidoglycan/LPS O-acetylase OafA/YrhL
MSDPVLTARSTVRLTGRLPALDGLRGVAIVAVLIHNVGLVQQRSLSPLMKLVYFVHAPGWIGVALFFALSGFLITSLLASSRGPGALGVFWIRRALRIFPLYYATLLVATLVLPHVRGLPDAFQGLDHMGWYWTYTCNWVGTLGKGVPAFAHFWSLAVEEQFYLLWPLLVLNLDDAKMLRACVGLALVALAARIAMRAEGVSPGAVYLFTVTRMDALTLGGAVALLLRDPGRLDWTLAWSRRALVGSALVILAMVPFTRAFNREDVWVQTVGYGVLSVFCAALVVEAVREPPSTLGRLLSARWLRWLGKYSYAIYVFHHPISQFLSPRFAASINAPGALSPLLSLLELEGLVAALSIGAALLSWNLIERWFLSLKGRLSSPRSHLGQTLSATADRSA